LASDAEIKFYNLKKRDVVADIGSKLGTFERSVVELGKNLSIYVCEMHGLRSIWLPSDLVLYSDLKLFTGSMRAAATAW
jgi:hypothetical protein